MYNSKFLLFVCLQIWILYPLVAQQKLSSWIAISPGIVARPFHTYFESGGVLGPFFVSNTFNYTASLGLMYQFSRKWSFQSGLTYFQHTVNVYREGGIAPYPSNVQWHRHGRMHLRTLEIPLNIIYQKRIKENLNWISRMGVSAGYFIQTTGLYHLTDYPFRISHYPYPYAAGLISTGFAFHFLNTSVFHFLFDFNTHFSRNISYSYDQLDYNMVGFDNYTNHHNMTEGVRFRYWRLGITVAYVFNTRAKKGFTEMTTE